ncbi:hypothetical protein L2E82_02276 [Cichorium intybus]|uniref:Uncharacterized protein n=1 Tax=Cichorium intybus TaxID=13427 RepID=A0ACB9H158_CICIN|nr:hypothetical protein L2E82_02276 [Cichorium intybus]
MLERKVHGREKGESGCRSLFKCTGLPGKSIQTWSMHTIAEEEEECDGMQTISRRRLYFPKSSGAFGAEAVEMGSRGSRRLEDAQGREAPIQRLADSIAGPFVYTVMTLSAATFAFWYYVGVHLFPDVLLNDISGPMENPLLLSLKLSTDVLVVS